MLNWCFKKALKLKNENIRMLISEIKLKCYYTIHISSNLKKGYDLDKNLVALFLNLNQAR